METCLYEHVNVSNTNTDVKKELKFSWKYFSRQLLVCSGIWCSYFILGFVFGAPTVTIPQLRKEINSTDAIDDEMASWISSAYGYGAIPWIFILPLLTDWMGRKYIFFIVCLSALISYIVFYFSHSILQILITGLIQSILFASQITISVIIVTEFTSPKYRGIFLTLKSANFNWGIWVANALGTFFHWRSIAIAGIVCSLYCMMTTFFWVESPYWLATKYRFEECAKAHRWAKGTSQESEKELKGLIQSHKQYRHEDAVKTSARKCNFLKAAYETVIERAFYKPVLLCIGVLTLYQTSGKLVCTVYAIDIIKKMTSTESTAYTGMLILDGVSVAGMYIGCGLSKVLKRKTLLMSGASLGIIFLLILSLYLYLIHLTVLKENNYVTITLLTLFSLSISCGPIILATSIYAELIPLRYKTSSILLIGLYNTIVASTFIKLGPLTFKTFNLHGAFLFYAILSSAFTLLIYKFLPETKDKTLQEIEESLLGPPKVKEGNTTYCKS